MTSNAIHYTHYCPNLVLLERLAKYMHRIHCYKSIIGDICVRMQLESHKYSSKRRNQALIVSRLTFVQLAMI